MAQTSEGEIASASFGKCNAGELTGKHVQFTVQGDPHDQFSAAVDEIINIDFVVDEVSVDAIHAHGGSWVDEDSIDETGEVVAGSSGDRPPGRQPFRSRKDFLDDYIM